MLPILNLVIRAAPKLVTRIKTRRIGITAFRPTVVQPSDPNSYQDLIKKYCTEDGNVDEATKLLEQMIEGGHKISESIFAHFIIGYSNQEKPPSMKEIFELMSSNGVTPKAPSYAAAMQCLIEKSDKYENATEELSSLCNELMSMDIFYNVQDTAAIMKSLVKVKDTIPEAQALYKYLLTPRRALSSEPSHVMKVLIEANEFKDASDLYWSQEPPQRVLDMGFMGGYYIKLLASCPNVPIEHALSECRKLREREYNKLAFNILYKTALNENNDALADACLKELMKIEPVRYAEESIKRLLKAGDVAGAIQCFSNVATRNRACGKESLLEYCIRFGEKDHLKKVMNMLSRLQGDRNSYFDLALACINLGKYKQAGKILTSPGFSIDTSRIYRACDALVKKKDTQGLEIFVNLVEDMQGVNKARLQDMKVFAHRLTSVDPNLQSKADDELSKFGNLRV